MIKYFTIALTLIFAVQVSAAGVTYEGGNGLGMGKHIVLISGDEEYRSEESLPMLGKILSRRHGFKCTVLFSINKETGEIDPNTLDNIPGLEALESADLMLVNLRFRNLPNEQMKFIHAYLQSGKPVIGIRPSVVAFKHKKPGNFNQYSCSSRLKEGFGLNVLGADWISHHGHHGKESTRGIPVADQKDHPILRGVGTMWGPTDVYTVNTPIKDLGEILVHGQVLKGMNPSGPTSDKKQMPLAWTKLYTTPKGRARVFMSTMGDGRDFLDENFRRLIVNACFWTVGLEEKIPAKTNVDIVGYYSPTAFGFNRFIKGRYPTVYNISDRAKTPANLKLHQGARITIIGNGLASRMAKFGDFETELQVRYPDAKLTIRNMGREGNTPAFRPQAGRGYDGQYAFPGAKDLVREDLKAKTASSGHFETPDQWLTKLKTDVVIACFGFSSSFDGPAGLARFKKELDAFLKHTLAQAYNGRSSPQVALVSPTAFEDLTKMHDTPDGIVENTNLALYSKAMQEVAAANHVLFVDAFTATQAWFDSNDDPVTQDGVLFNAKGFQLFAPFLADHIFGKSTAKAEARREAVHTAVNEKNWLWHNYYKIPNGVHVYGRRYKPYGPQNYPDELRKAAEMTQVRDRAIWAAVNGKAFDVAAADAKTHKLPKVPTNFKPSGKTGDLKYQSGEDTIADLTVPEGYKIELFASEARFKNLANPVQMAFDNKGRLWVANMPSYPHWRVGDPKPSDTLIILEDTDGDGKADKETVFADDLHLPVGFELAPEGVYVSQADSLVLLKDTDGDDQYDVKEIVLSGFDDHDTHVTISAFCAGPSGAIYMSEGIFVHTNVETAYGTVRCTNGGFMRYNPDKKHLERSTQLSIPNPWGIAFDDYGQNFFISTSSPAFHWMGRSTIKPKYGRNLRPRDLLTSNKVRPTSGLEFVSSRHFPDEVQGDILINNTIGFLGTKQHSVQENGTGYTTKYRQDLLRSKDKNFRPVDLEFAPDGSLYVVDWSNVLIGHMQHNARDPHRDHVHGRVYRITYPSRPLVKPAKVAGASISELLENLKLPEYRTRYRTRRELRGRDAMQVAAVTKNWVEKLDKSDARYERHVLEALWVLWGVNQVDEALVTSLLKAADHRVRAAAARVVRYNMDKLVHGQELLELAAGDDHGRVRLEAINTANWLDPESGRAILAIAKNKPIDSWMKPSFDHANNDLTGAAVAKERDLEAEVWKKAGMDKMQIAVMKQGREVYHREAHCGTCHQGDGKGLPAAGFPGIAGTKWVNQDPERLIKLSLKGVMGEMDVQGKKFNGAMTPFEGLLNDKQLASVLTYVRKSFGNDASAISPEQVRKVRKAEKKKIGLYRADELLKAHPHE